MAKKIQPKAQKKDPADGLLGWRDLPIGAVITNAGNSEKYLTGNWNQGKIKFIPDNCTNCGMCFLACPDSAIVHDENGKMIGIDQDHCKKCQLCVKACNFKALELN